MFNKTLNAAIDAAQTFKYSEPNNLFQYIFGKCVDNLGTMRLRIFKKKFPLSLQNIHDLRNMILQNHSTLTTLINKPGPEQNRNI